LVVDGRLESKLDPGKTVEFSRSLHNAVFVRFGDTFLERSLKRLTYDREPV